MLAQLHDHQHRDVSCKPQLPSVSLGNSSDSKLIGQSSLHSKSDVSFTSHSHYFNDLPTHTVKSNPSTSIMNNPSEYNQGSLPSSLTRSRSSPTLAPSSLPDKGAHSNSVQPPYTPPPPPSTTSYRNAEVEIIRSRLIKEMQILEDKRMRAIRDEEASKQSSMFSSSSASDVPMGRRSDAFLTNIEKDKDDPSGKFFMLISLYM